MKPPNDSARDSCLDVLRFIAAYAVVLYHFGFRGYAADGLQHIEYRELAPLLQYGYLGVQLFFIISGYVIFLSLENRSARDFAVSRAIRIYPTFWVCLALSTTVILSAQDPKFQITIAQALINITLIPETFGGHYVDSAYWSLAVELQFYLGALLLTKGVPERILPFAIIAWVIAGALASASTRLLGFPVPMLGGNYVPFFGIGIAIYQLHRGHSTRPALLLLGVSLLLALISSVFQMQKLNAYYSASMKAYITIPMIMLMVFMVYVSPRIKIASTRLRRVAVALGGVTYPLYLAHQNIGYITLNRFFDQTTRWTGLAVTLFGVTMLAIAVYYLFDRPARRFLMARFAPSSKPAAMTSAAPVIGLSGATPPRR